MNEAKTLKRNLLFNTVGNIVYFACQWLVTGFFIKRLSDAATGDYNAGLIATAMIVTNVFLTLASYGMRAYQVSDIKDKYKSGDYILSRVITVAAAVLLCVIYSLVIGYAGEQFWCIMLFLVYKLIEAVTDVFHGFCQKNERMDIIGISYAVRGVASVAVFCLVFSLTKNVNFTLLLMTLLCLAFSAVYDIALTRRFYLPAERSKNGAWRLLLECLPLAVYVFLNTAAASVPKLALERLMGTETIGVYNLVNSPVLILQVGLAFLFTPFKPSARQGHARLFKDFGAYHPRRFRGGDSWHRRRAAARAVWTNASLRRRGSKLQRAFSAACGLHGVYLAYPLLLYAFNCSSRDEGVNYLHGARDSGQPCGEHRAY